MRATRVIIAAVLTLCAFVSVLHWWNKGRPVMLVDAPSDRLRCVSYAPFHKPFQSPFDTALSVSQEQIDTDLKLLAQRFDCVRTYSVGQGLPEVPRLAGRHGLRVLLGVWIGRAGAENERELTQAVGLARKYGSSIEAIVVGNEVLLRGEQPCADRPRRPPTGGTRPCPSSPAATEARDAPDAPPRPRASPLRALLRARIYEVFLLLCPRCVEPMRLIAFVTDSARLPRRAPQRHRTSPRPLTVLPVSG